jgi:hypothetical protein
MAKNRHTFFALLVITLLQLSNTWHTAEHGTLEHEHAGKVCEVCTAAKQPTVTPHTTANGPELSINSVFYNSKVYSTIKVLKINAYTSRAPPYFT